LWSQEEGTPLLSAAAKMHLAALSERVQPLSMRIPGRGHASPRLLQPPVLRPANKGGNPDGGVWLWVEDKLPIAVLSVWNRGPVWYYENTTLADEAFEVSGWSGPAWQSPKEARQWIVQDDRVPESAAARQRVLREISRRFTAWENRQDVKSELRILPTPLYNYSDQNRGVVEGALFAFVLGTDPEVLMQIEARTGADGPKWQVAFARAASAELKVRMGEQQVWSAADARAEYATRRDLGYCIIKEAN
jgi:hypothetical protein